MEIRHDKGTAANYPEVESGNECPLIGLIETTQTDPLSHTMLNTKHRTASIQYYLFIYNVSIITTMTFYSLGFLGIATSSCITMKLFHSPSPIVH